MSVYTQYAYATGDLFMYILRTGYDESLISVGQSGRKYIIAQSYKLIHELSPVYNG